MSEHTDANLQLDNQICFALYSASNALVRAYRPLLKALGITYPQYLTLLVLWQQDSISVKVLGQQLRLDTGTLTPLLKRLEGKGLLLRQRCEQDDRVRVITLTPAGQALKQQATQIPLSLFEQAGMSKEQLQQMKLSCEILLANLAD